MHCNSSSSDTLEEEEEEKVGKECSGTELGCKSSSPPFSLEKICDQFFFFFSLLHFARRVKDDKKRQEKSCLFMGGGGCNNAHRWPLGLNPISDSMLNCRDSHSSGTVDG